MMITCVVQENMDTRQIGLRASIVGSSLIAMGVDVRASITGSARLQDDRANVMRSPPARLHDRELSWLPAPPHVASQRTDKQRPAAT